MSTPIQEAQRLGQSVWYDNIRRGLLTSGEMRRLVELGITGITSNPTIFEKAIAGSTDYDDSLLAMAQARKDSSETYEALAAEDIRAAAEILRPIYDGTWGRDGYVSMEVSPTLAYDTNGTIEEARRLFSSLNCPNVMIKVPATPQGIPAIRRLIGEGINVNITLIFSLDAFRRVRLAYIEGLEDFARRGGDLSKVASVASFFVSRVDTAVDTLLEELIRGGQEELRGLQGKCAVANARLAYQAFRATFGGKRFASLRAKGARVQRPLWASTGTKNPAYSDLLYVESLMGPDTVNTMPPATLNMFLEHGSVSATLEERVDESNAVMSALNVVGVSMEEVTGRLLDEGVKSFADSFQKLKANIEEKIGKLQAGQHVHADAKLGPLQSVAEAHVSDLEKRDVVRRIWQKDHTVWKPEPTEITNRLGWLTVADIMSDNVQTLQAFANEVRDAGFRHVVLLGMGGSSLGPEVLRQTFGSASGFPELIVLDSTVPAGVSRVAESIDPARTLFIVSSKSGSTIEPLCFYAYFRSLVEKASGNLTAGQNFVAITDSGNSLESLALDQGFRRVFLNPPDVGGRYSVLSYFGLVPAALIGVDVAALLDRADRMREGCDPCVPAHDNPGAWLGAVMGAMALNGRDKLTLVTSPSIQSFGLWVEQLIAESTGKEGKGIIPISGEPLLPPDLYGDDRLFVYLRLEGDDNAATDSALERAGSSGHPVMRIVLRDRYDLGAEFFRWEFATAVAGSFLGIHPFDQPNVQGAKDLTGSLLKEYEQSGSLPNVEGSNTVKDLLSAAKPGNYLAIMTYLHQTPELDQSLMELRTRVLEKFRVATTAGYGPRFLHSTGQLHKGGPDKGLFIQITAAHEVDLPIPGQPYTFGVLADAQALGDLQALQVLGRPVVRIHLDSDVGAQVQKLIEELA